MGAAMLALWSLAIFVGGLATVVSQSALTATTLAVLTTHRPVPPHLARQSPYAGRSYILQPKIAYREYGYVAAGLASLAFVLAGVTGAALRTVLPHWRRRHRYAVALATPILIAVVMTAGWWAVAPYLLWWSLRVTLGFAGLQIVGHLLGIMLAPMLLQPVYRMVASTRVRRLLLGDAAHGSVS